AGPGEVAHQPDQELVGKLPVAAHEHRPEQALAAIVEAGGSAAGAGAQLVDQEARTARDAAIEAGPVAPAGRRRRLAAVVATAEAIGQADPRGVHEGLHREAGRRHELGLELAVAILEL